jgi:hypothetical protein
MDIRSVLPRVTTALRNARIDQALIGGLALAAHRAARAPVDIDLLVDGDRDEDVDRLLRAQGYAPLHRSERGELHLGRSRRGPRRLPVRAPGDRSRHARAGDFARGDG